MQTASLKQKVLTLRYNRYDAHHFIAEMQYPTKSIYQHTITDMSAQTFHLYYMKSIHETMESDTGKLSHTIFFCF
jgi:hypothetical protein